MGLSPSGNGKSPESIRELDSVGNALCDVPRGSAIKRNGTEVAGYSDSPCFEFPDTPSYLFTDPKTVKHT